MIGRKFKIKIYFEKAYTFDKSKMSKIISSFFFYGEVYIIKISKQTLFKNNKKVKQHIKKYRSCRKLQTNERRCRFLRSRKCPPGQKQQ